MKGGQVVKDSLTEARKRLADAHTASWFVARVRGRARSPVRPRAGSRLGHLLTVDHYLDWEQVADPQISPDGSQIVYTDAG